MRKRIVEKTGQEALGEACRQNLEGVKHGNGEGRGGHLLE